MLPSFKKEQAQQEVNFEIPVENNLKISSGCSRCSIELASGKPSIGALKEKLPSNIISSPFIFAINDQELEFN
jgi:hypothetical protein